jgi:nickel transport protein
MRLYRIFGFTLLLGLLLVSPALAHKVNLFAYVEGGKIYTESYFPDGRPVSEGQVEIRDAADQLLVSGRTNDQGLYECPIPQVAELKIHIIASMGHRNLFTLSKAEIEAGQ